MDILPDIIASIPHSPLLLACFADLYNPGAKDVIDVPPPMPIIAPPPILAPPTPVLEELIQQSQWNLQQQEQHLLTLRQVHPLKLCQDCERMVT